MYHDVVMDDACHPCHDRPVTATEALDDRNYGWKKFNPPDFYCPECHEEVRLRKHGRGSTPFFYHLPRNKDCGRRVTGNEDTDWPDDIDSIDAPKFAELLTKIAVSEFGDAFRLYPLSELDPWAATLLAFLATRETNGDNVAATAIHLLTKPSYAIVLRAISASTISEWNKNSREALPVTEFCSRSLRKITESTWRQRLRRVTPPAKSLARSEPIRLEFVRLLGQNMCFCHSDSRTEVLSTSRGGLTVAVSSSEEVTIGIARSTLPHIQAVGIDLLDTHLHFAHGEAAILAPSYGLLSKPDRRPYLYIIP